MMEKTYHPNDIENKWYQYWEENGYFKPTGHGTPYCIVLPPPNVTGSLHLGHGFQVTLMDALIRYHQKSGFNTHWQTGTDHAGISTQMVVERQLAAKGINRHDLGRDAFVEKVWEWMKTSGQNIKKQLRRMGAAMDWTQERFTMDEGIDQAVKTVFVQLYEEGLIYRDKKLVNWDPVLQTAISDLEVVTLEKAGYLWHIRYPLIDSNESLVVATTRPETLLGDTAVAVHPEDQRYQHLIGKMLRLPLTDRQIPIIADTYVDQTFGTGCVKITPAHDFNDYEIGKRHDLPLINVFTPEAKMNQQVPEPYQQMDRFEAREKIIHDLKSKNLIEKIENHTLQEPRGDRSGAVIEPYLTNQWFVATKTLAEKATDAVKNKKIEFIPSNWEKTYFQWLEGIHDWCISRQLWWGHRIPAWYDDTGNIYVGYNETDIRKKYELSNAVKLKQEADVLDTWFSSALWPFATLGWPEKTNALKTFYPTNLLVTGFDIIFFWVARMVMMGLKFTNEVPFRQVYITGLIRDSEGQKMSKSKGNTLDPLDLIDGITLENLIAKRTKALMQPAMAAQIAKQTMKEFPEGIPAFGTDALRFTYCALASTGRDVRFDLARLAGYRNFCNKLWNAARFVLMNTSEFSHKNKLAEPSLSDQWIQSRLQKLIKQTQTYFKNYRFDLLAQALYDFTWNEYCDWYVELAKIVLYDKSASTERLMRTQYTLITVLSDLLNLLHPLIPFITEEIWQQLMPILDSPYETIIKVPYPQYQTQLENVNAEIDISWIQTIITTLRTLRAEMNISPGKMIPLLLTKGSEEDKKQIAQHQILLKKLTKLESIRWLTSGEITPASIVSVVGELELRIPMAGLIEKTAELKRLEKQLIKLAKEQEQLQNRLNNNDYIAKAPADVVNDARERLKEIKITLTKLNSHKQLIEQL